MHYLLVFLLTAFLFNQNYSLSFDGDDDRVEIINNSTQGLTEFSFLGVTSISDVPQEFSLSEAYPNPFNPSTTIDFSVPTESVVNIGIYDVSGRNIKTLVDDTYQPGYYSIVWDGSGHSSGVYFVKMTSESYTQTQKLMMIK